MVRRRVILIAGLLGLAVTVGGAVWPMSVTNGFVCDGLGGAARWQLGLGAEARAAAIRRQADMSKVLSDLAHNRRVLSTPLGREAKDDANDAHNRAQRSLPQMDSCYALARARLGWSPPAGVIVFGAGLGLAWLLAQAAAAAASRREEPAIAGAPPACPLCGERLGVDGICASCSGFEAGHTGDWRTTLPDSPPDIIRPRD
jgi:hypothetical protein